jgi:hypothetical protein
LPDCFAFGRISPIIFFSRIFAVHVLSTLTGFWFQLFFVLSHNRWKYVLTADSKDILVLQRM